MVEVPSKSDMNKIVIVFWNMPYNFVFSRVIIT